MIGEGESAPTFELPATIDGEVERVALEEYLGRDVVVLAFYPGDFNPVCSDGSTGLDELDVFTIQKDVSVLGISGDSVYSHRAFAEEYGLGIPLLSDTRGEVARDYGVLGDEDGYLTRRAVFVVDHSGIVVYAWVAADVSEVPDVSTIRAAVDEIGSEPFARARYRVGHARYVEGRRAFTSALKAFEDGDWLLAERDFTQACEEFEEATNEFDTALRFGEGGAATAYFERAERKSEALRQAAEWLADAANAFTSGESGEGKSLQQDAQTPLETARRLHEPPDPDEFPPAEHPETDLEEPAESPDIDAADAETDSEPASESGFEFGHTPTAESGDAGTNASARSGTDIDDEELAEISAELERQTEAVQKQAGDTAEQSAVADGEDGEDGGDNGDDEENADDGDVDLDGTGKHGVPDSL